MKKSFKAKQTITKIMFVTKLQFQIEDMPRATSEIIDLGSNDSWTAKEGLLVWTYIFKKILKVCLSVNDGYSFFLQNKFVPIVNK